MKFIPVSLVEFGNHIVRDGRETGEFAEFDAKPQINRSPLPFRRFFYKVVGLPNQLDRRFANFFPCHGSPALNSFAAASMSLTSSVSPGPILRVTRRNRGAFEISTDPAPKTPSRGE